MREKSERKAGIDSIHFYTPSFVFPLDTLAHERSINPEKYHVGIGQNQMSILPPDEDIVTMGANAAYPLMKTIDKESIKLLLFATESGIDQSKAAGIWVHHLLGLHPNCRVVELKQACYSATCALQLAADYIEAHPDDKVLVIASDNARYGFNTPGEPTQGCGAVAIILSSTPKLMAFERGTGVHTQHVMDFFRPNYLTEAVVDGKYSTKIYLSTLGACWEDYTKKTGRTFFDHNRFCYHIPFSRMAEKAHERLAKCTNTALTQEEIESHVGQSLLYAKEIGNTYAAALTIGLCSLLEHDQEDLALKRIGFFSYGSGCVGEFFSGIVQNEYEKALFAKDHELLLASRATLSYNDYKDFFEYKLPEDGLKHETPLFSKNGFRLTGVSNHERLYGP